VILMSADVMEMIAEYAPRARFNGGGAAAAPKGKGKAKAAKKPAKKKRGAA
jgi:hypothetical protein